METLGHDNPDLETEHFVDVIVCALINSQTVPNATLCERWLADGYVNENELESVLEAYERCMGYGS